MTFIHVSDVHLGIQPDNDKPWSLDRSYDIKETFERVIKRCKDLNCALLLISGDLWNSQPLTADLNEINDLFKQIPSTQVVIVSGECDRIRKNSSIISYMFNRNVHYILSAFPSKVNLDDLSVVVHGFSYHEQENRNSLVDTIENPPADKKFHILLAHGGDEEHCPIDYNLLSTKNFSYCALGHLHQPKEIVSTKIVYSGSLEPLCAQETGDHGIYVGELNPITMKLESLHFEPLAQAKYIPLTIKINEHTTNQELMSTIANEISAKGNNNIYSIEINGDRDPKMIIDTALIQKTTKIVKLIDNSQPKFDFTLLSKQHPNDMIGAFIRSFGDEKPEDMTYIRRKALYYGIDALLKSSDIS